MKATNICFTLEQHKILEERAKLLGISKAEVLRRLVNESVDIPTPLTSPSNLEPLSIYGNPISQTEEELGGIAKEGWSVDSFSKFFKKGS